MAKTLALAALTIGRRGPAVSYHAPTLPASVVVAGSYGSRKTVAMAVLTIGRRANVSAVFYSLLDTVISGSNCPPAPQVPLTGQRYPGYYLFS